MGLSLFVWAAPGVGQQWMEVICAHRRTEVVDMHLNHTVYRICLTGCLISQSTGGTLESVSLNYHSE